MRHIMYYSLFPTVLSLSNAGPAAARRSEAARKRVGRNIFVFLYGRAVAFVLHHDVGRRRRKRGREIDTAEGSTRHPTEHSFAVVRLR